MARGTPHVCRSFASRVVLSTPWQQPLLQMLRRHQLQKQLKGLVAAMLLDSRQGSQRPRLAVVEEPRSRCATNFATANNYHTLFLFSFLHPTLCRLCGCS